MENNNELIGVILAVVVGTFTILASIFNWNFFFENRKAKFFVSIFGREGARIFYAVFGFFFFFLAFKMMKVI